MAHEKDVFAVILVGGKGKRLMPLSTNDRPKAFLSVTKDRKTMFRVTVDRINKLVRTENIFVSANHAHERLVKNDLPEISAENLILEPVSRNTAPAIALAVHRLSLQKKSKEAIIVVLPADQYVIGEAKYLDSIKKAVNFVRTNDAIVILGLEPTFPATGFGYVKYSSARFAQDIYKVEKFTEKPDLNTAKKFVREGWYLWNAGAFIFKAGAMLEALNRFAPDISAILGGINTGNLAQVYEKFPNISIDYAVMEKAPNIYCVRGTYGWRDIGSFASLKEVLKMESRKFVEKGDKVVEIL